MPPHHNTPDGEYAAAVRDVLCVTARSVAHVRSALAPLFEVSTTPRNAAAQAAAACAAHDAVLLLLDADSCPLWRAAWRRRFLFSLLFDPPLRWCPADPAIPVLDAIGWRLRAQTAAHRARRGAGGGGGAPALRFFRPDAMNVALHVRNGDVCVSCGAESLFWYHTLLGALSAALRGCALNVVFFAQEPLPWAPSAFEARVVTAANASLADVAAHFLGAHVLVTSGSSLSTSVAAFAPNPFVPLILESMTKESTWGCRAKGCPGRTHVLQRGTSIRIDARGGMIDASVAEVRALMQTTQPDAWSAACGAGVDGKH